MSDDLIIDLSNYKDRVGARVAPGRYRVQVEDVEAAQSQAKNPMVNIWLRIIGGEFDGQTIVDRLTLTEKSMFRVVGFMQGIGLPTPKKRLKLNIRQFLGKTLDIDVDDGEPYNGRVKSEVKGYIKIARQPSAGNDLDLADDAEEEVPETSNSAVDLPEIEDTATTGASDPEASPTQSTKAADDDAETLDTVDLDRIEL